MNKFLWGGKEPTAEIEKVFFPIVKRCIGRRSDKVEVSRGKWDHELQQLYILWTDKKQTLEREEDILSNETCLGVSAEWVAALKSEENIGKYLTDTHWCQKCSLVFRLQATFRKMVASVWSTVLIILLISMQVSMHTWKVLDLSASYLVWFMRLRLWVKANTSFERFQLVDWNVFVASMHFVAHAWKVIW